MKVESQFTQEIKFKSVAMIRITLFAENVMQIHRFKAK